MKKIILFLFFTLMLGVILYSILSTLQVTEETMKAYIEQTEKDLPSDIHILHIYTHDHFKIVSYEIADLPTDEAFVGIYIFKSNFLFKDRYSYLGSGKTNKTNQKLSFYAIRHEPGSKTNWVIIYGRNTELDDRQLYVQISEKIYLENIENEKYFLFFYQIKFPQSFPDMAKIIDINGNNIYL